jgi:hypothetical protein
MKPSYQAPTNALELLKYAKNLGHEVCKLEGSWAIRYNCFGKGGKGRPSGPRRFIKFPSLEEIVDALAAPRH